MRRRASVVGDSVAVGTGSAVGLSVGAAVQVASGTSVAGTLAVTVGWLGCVAVESTGDGRSVDTRVAVGGTGVGVATGELDGVALG